MAASSREGRMRPRRVIPFRGWREAWPALRQTLVLLRPHLHGQRAIVVGGLAALLLEVVVRLLEPWPVKVVLDAVLPAAVGQDVGTGVLRLVVGAAVAVVLLAALRALAAYLSTVAFALVGARVTTRLRGEVYERLLGGSAKFHGRSRGGDLVTRVVGDVGRVQEAAITAGMPLFGNALTFVGMATVMLVLDPLLALAVLAVVPLFLLQGGTASGKITGASRAQRRREGHLAGDAGEAFAAIGVVQAYGLQDQLGSRFRTANLGSLAEGVKARRLAAGLERRTDIVVGMATGVVLAVGAQRVLTQSITPGELVVFLSYLKTAFKPMRDVAKHTGRIARATASGERVAEALEDAAPLPEAACARPLRRVVGELRLEGVTVEHHPGVPVLRGAHLRIRAGERVAVVGASGSGKSTLLQLLLRFVDPVEGRVTIDGHDVMHLTRESVRARTAVVLQEAVLFATTLAENIRFGRLGATDDEVARAAEAAGVHEFAIRLPDGYDTVVGERGSTLSGGQRQRVAIARALLRDPAVVLLDEPTTGLDETSAAIVLCGLARLGEGRTTILVTHDERLIGLCDRVVALVDGGFVEMTRDAEPPWAGTVGAR